MRPGRWKAGALFAGLAVAAGLVNLTPLRFGLLAFPHGFLLPAAVQAALLVVAVGTLWRVAGQREGWQPSPWWRRATVALFAILLVTCRTTFPSVHGDGENGAPGHVAREQLHQIDAVEGEHRLPAHINRFLAAALPRTPSWSYHVGMPERPNSFPTFGRFREAREKVNESWILLVMIAGMATVAGIALASSRMKATESERLGVASLFLFAPPMLNFFGHFDSYGLSVLLVLAWTWCLGRTAGGSRPWLGATIVAGLLATATHPALILLPLLTCAHLVFVHLGPRISGRRIAILGLVTGIAFGLLPLLLPAGRAPEWTMLRGPLLARFAVERALLLCAASLPALLLAALTPWRGRAAPAAPAPSRATALGTLCAALVSGFTLNYTLGPLDELNFSAVHGTLVLGAAWLLWRESSRRDRTVLLAGLLGIAWFVPKAHVFSGGRVIDYFRVLQPQSVCVNNRSASPYILLALRCPVDTPAGRVRLLEVLQEGAKEPTPLWNDFKPVCLSYLAAWCYEFGSFDEGRRILHWHLENGPIRPIVLWLDGSRFTSRHENKATGRMREDSERWLRAMRGKDPSNPMYDDMLGILGKCGRGDVTEDDIRTWGTQVELK